MDRLKSVIKQYWGFDTFRPLQRNAMACVMEGRDSLVVLPTGGGKSLCYQAPALIMPDMAVVVSPLLSLMKDQVDALNANGVPAVRIDSSMTNKERIEAHNAIQERRVKLLYVSPERMAQPSFIAYLQVIGVAYFVVDEAHCISHWGHDFRPEYRELRALRDNFPDTSIHAYTATATEHVRNDIIEQMRLNTPEKLVGVFDRPNLHFQVKQRRDEMREILDFLSKHKNESGIVYCLRRNDVDALCECLADAGYKTLPYHAGLPAEVRKQNQDRFSRDETDIIVATIAFGMGIDKSNVRFVLHTALPKSIEHYQQETGRAGRDGLPADCCLLYSFQDFQIWASFIDKIEDPDPRNVARKKLEDMLRYCKSLVCRHKALSEYFGQEYVKNTCGACDVCLGNFEQMKNAAPIACHILNTATALGAIAGPHYTAQVLTGLQEERISSRGHDKLPSYGALSEYDIRIVRDWIEQMVQQGYLEKRGEYHILFVTDKGREALNGSHVPRLMQPSKRKSKRSASSRKSVAAGPVNPILFENLKRMRLETARELGVAPFIVFSDASLRDMTRRMPRDKMAFLTVEGVGEKKCAAFADIFLQVIHAYLEEHPDAVPETETAIAIPIQPPKRKRVRLQAAPLFQQRLPIEEVAKKLGRAISTIEGYLTQYFAASNLTDPTPYASLAVLERIRPFYKDQDMPPLRPIYEALNGEVSYTEIRICIACLKNEPKKKDSIAPE